MEHQYQFKVSTISFTTKYSSFVYHMLHIVILAYGFDSPSKMKTPPTRKWLEPYKIYVIDQNVVDDIYYCYAAGQYVLRAGDTVT